MRSRPNILPSDKFLSFWKCFVFFHRFPLFLEKKRVKFGQKLLDKKGSMETYCTKSDSRHLRQTAIGQTIY